MKNAHETATDLGARPLSTAIERLAARARLAITPLAPAPTDASGLGLSRREDEVLALIAAGCTNREIAQRLFISEKTAGTHVSHILTKLGVTNRSAAGAIAHRVGLAP